MAGSAIGLGNIWRFSYIMGKYGGAAFILVYLAAIFLIGLPIMLCELSLGRASGKGPLEAMTELAPKRTTLSFFAAVALILGAAAFAFKGMYFHAGVTGFFALGALLFGWGFLGFTVTFLTPLMIAVFYSVVGGWIIIYTIVSPLGKIFREPTVSAELLDNVVTASGSQYWVTIAAAAAFFLATAFIVMAGVQKGIERFSKIFMPIIFILIIVIIIRALMLPGAKEGLRFLFLPDFSKMSAEGIMAALGQAFFTLSLGSGVGIAYGSYLGKSSSLPKTAITIVIMDTIASILAGLAIFPLLFATGLSPEEGTSLVFKVLPAAFGKLPLSPLWGTIFFFTLLLAALTSSISMLEGAVQGIMQKLYLGRAKAVILLIVVLGPLVPLTAVSAANYANIPKLGKFFSETLQLRSDSFFAILDNTTCLWLMPLAGLMTLLYVSFVWGKKKAMEEMNCFNAFEWLFSNIWFFIVRFISPVLVILAFLKGLGIFL